MSAFPPGCQTERVINAVEDGIFLANQIYERALLRFVQGNNRKHEYGK